MRNIMAKTVSEIIKKDKNTALLLIDIGVWAFRDLLENENNRVRNIGIFEQGTISLAAGLALTGIIPTVYGISSFIVQRSLEQLKLDFVYQKCGGNFITTGASYDFSSLGYSHYCPEDVAILRQLPGMEIVAPGTPSQFEILYRKLYNNGNPTYFRMTDYCSKTNIAVEFGKANVIKTGSCLTVIAVAETLDMVLEGCSDLDVTILYYTTLAPFDYYTLKYNCNSCKVLICEPFYRGTLHSNIIEALQPNAVRIESIGVPLKVLRNYGSKPEKDIYCGLTSQNVRDKALALIRE